MEPKVDRQFMNRCKHQKKEQISRNKSTENLQNKNQGQFQSEKNIKTYTEMLTEPNTTRNYNHSPKIKLSKSQWYGKISEKSDSDNSTEELNSE